MWNWLRRFRHQHEWSVWCVQEKTERLFGPYGFTKSPAYYNERHCVLPGCHFTQMKRINTRSKDGD